MESKLVAIGTIPKAGVHLIRFYYKLPQGGRDLYLPAWEIPANSFDHMQAVVRAFNDTEG